jgi:hypothetical protein
MGTLMVGIATASSNDYFVTVTWAKKCINYIIPVIKAQKIVSAPSVTEAYQNLYQLLRYRY